MTKTDSEPILDCRIPEIRVDAELMAAIAKRAVTEDRTYSSMVRRMLRFAVENMP